MLNLSHALSLLSRLLGFCLAGLPLPQIYTTAFDLAQPTSGKITVTSLNKILGASGLPAATVAKVWTLSGGEWEKHQQRDFHATGSPSGKDSVTTRHMHFH